MKIELNLANDTEFRAFIRECIIAEVKSITRQELTDIILQEIKTKVANIQPKSNYHFEHEFDKHIRQFIASEVRTSGRYYSDPSKKIEAYIREVAQEEMRKVIVQMFKEGIRL